MARTYRYISADSHLEVPPDAWAHWVPEKYRADFPHVESDWPNSMGIIQEMFAGVPEDEKHKMVAGNAIEFFGLERG